MVKNPLSPSGSSQETSSLICLGEITSAHGIKGAVKLKVFTADPEDILSYGPLLDQSGKVVQLRIVRTVSADSLIAIVQGIGDRTAAETLRGIKLFVPRAQLPETEEDEFYHTDLIGMTVETTEGDVIGQIKSVENHGAGDFLEIMTPDCASLTILFTKEAVPLVNLKDRKVVVLSEHLLSTKELPSK